MAKLSGEQRTAAELAVLIYETVLENLKNGGRPVMARALEPDENYFSDDPEKMSSPMIKKFLGSFEAAGRKLDLWLCSEINWYAPGKIYVGLKADSIDEAPLDFSGELRDVLQQFQGEAQQEPVDGWICWRYITVNGDSTVNSESGAVPHFKVANDALRQLAGSEKTLKKFILTLLEVWNRFDEQAQSLLKTLKK